MTESDDELGTQAAMREELGTQAAPILPSGTTRSDPIGTGRSSGRSTRTARSRPTVRRLGGGLVEIPAVPLLARQRYVDKHF